MSKIRIHQFEQALNNLCLILRDARNYYRDLFYAMVSGIDISKDLVTDTYSTQISTFRKELHEKQRQLSKELTGGSIVCSIEEFSRFPGLEFTIDIDKRRQDCLRLYDELQNYMKGMEHYYSNKVEEYRDFFGTIYKDMNKDARYHIQDLSTAKQSGLLISTNA